MTRPRLDATSQRQLIDDLRVLIDSGRPRDLARLHDIAVANPRSIRSRYVLHNIGRRRVFILDQFIGQVEAFDRLSPEERTVVGDASDYDWAARPARETSRARGRA